jgi:NAD(P)-dependent dehydrogenase (short-subunit alcohol dehydrogenase family)
VAADLGGRFVRADVGNPADWEGVVAEAEESLGGLDLADLYPVVTTQQPDICAVTDEQVRRVFGANVDGVIFGTRAVVPAMQRRGGGAIVATASLAGIIAFAPDPLYTATKHAVVGFVRSVAPQLAGRNITINAVCPGIVDTPLVGAARERLKEAGFPMIAPEEIAAAVLQCMTGGAESGDCLVCQAGRAAEAHAFNEPPARGR